MRLRSGAQVGEGRVEVLMNRQWGTVCDHRWNLISASVVCRQLGFGSAREALFGAQLGQGEQGDPGCVPGPSWATGSFGSPEEEVHSLGRGSHGCDLQRSLTHTVHSSWQG